MQSKNSDDELYKNWRQMMVNVQTFEIISKPIAFSGHKTEFI